MKKILVLGLALIMFLAGCNAQEEPETTETQTTEPTGLYVENSEIERQTDGAVRQYSLGETAHTWLGAIGDQLLLGTGGEGSSLSLLTGENCEIAASAQFDVDVLAGGCQPTYSGVVYYDKQQNQAVYLDTRLKETDRVQLPDDMQGKPVFSPDGGEIYYCVEQQIRGLDTTNGISRLIKSHACTEQTLLGCYFDGEVLSCSMKTEDGGQSVVYLSAQTGRTLSNDGKLLQLETYGDSFFAVRMDGVVEQHMFGTMEGAEGLLVETAGTPVQAIALGGVAYSDVGEDGSISLSFYETQTGLKTAAVQIPNAGTPIAYYADRWTSSIWILTESEGNQSLLQWNVKNTPVTEQTVYTTPVYTAQAPDEEGLAACQERVDALNSTHGVTIRIWEEGAKYDGGYTVTPEYQPQAINECLDALEPVLREFPENFLKNSDSSRLRICIVRSIAGENGAVQFRYEGYTFILLPVGVDVRNEFIREMGYVVDSHILGNSAQYDYWEQLNPEGFVYGDATTYSEDYLKEGDLQFANQASMESATYERSYLFWQAMQPDNGELFRSETMQSKLLLLCQAIRDTWRYEKKTEVYPWEQYLNESIAYTEE